MIHKSNSTIVIYKLIGLVIGFVVFSYELIKAVIFIASECLTVKLCFNAFFGRRATPDPAVGLAPPSGVVFHFSGVTVRFSHSTVPYLLFLLIILSIFRFSYSFNPLAHIIHAKIIALFYVFVFSIGSKYYVFF